MKNQALFSLKDKSKQLRCDQLQILFGALRVNLHTGWCYFLFHAKKLAGSWRHAALHFGKVFTHPHVQGLWPEEMGIRATHLWTWLLLGLFVQRQRRRENDNFQWNPAVFLVETFGLVWT